MEKNYTFIKALILVVVLNCFTTLVHGQMAKCKGKYLANIIPNSVRSDFNTYWNGVTAENGCKWDAVEPNRDQYNWTAADRAYKHAKDNGFIFRWHTFIWGSQEPNWIGALNAQDTRDEVEELMKLVAQRYPGIDYIDVVNEALHAPASYREDLGGANNGVDAADRGTGYDWIVWSFRKARQYFPNAKLVLNDYGLENDPTAINNMLKIVKVLKDRNLIDGFGTQAHTFNVDGLSAATLKSRLDLMATGGLPIYVTELDLTGSPASEANQLTSYKNLFPVYWEHPNVGGITLWGYVEGATWKAGTGLLNSNGTERSAMTWLKSYMAGRPNVAGCGSTPTNTPPTVSISAPANNATFTAPASITITANAADADGTVNNVQFYNGTTLIGSDATSPYSFSWANVSAGTYSITAKATDNAGAVTTSATISVTVAAPNTPPVVSISAPINNESYIAPAGVTISATASDVNGTVSNVQFYNGTTLLGSDATSPYSFSWANVVAGTYTLTARATDNNGAITTSIAVTITVNPPVANQAPTVAIISPANNAAFTSPAAIAITANASDVDGTVSSVQFYNGTTLLGTDATAPYSFNWSNVAEGSYSVSARATDNSGAVTTSATVTVIVSAGTPVNQAPIVSIASPVNNSSFIAPANISIAANAADVDGAVSSVQFFNGSTLLGADTIAPYSFDWISVADGTYSITVKATDNNGAVTTSTAVTVKVNSPNITPVVNITSPANNSSLVAPATTVIAVSANDVDGTINSVQFFNGATLLGSDATFPYSFSWAGIAAGTYSITAKATDNSGAVTTSTAVVITVGTAPVGDLIGPGCGAVNSTISFEVNPSKKTNATSYSWWVNGYAQSVTPVSGQPYKVNINTGAYFTGGQVCVQIQYNAAPYSTMLCKPITKCASTSKMSGISDIEATTIAPNPSTDVFVLTVNESVETYKIVDDKGTIIYNGGSLGEGESVSLGAQLPGGLYLVMIQYYGGRVETKKIQKN